jgi:hypothetical protein
MGKPVRSLRLVAEDPIDLKVISAALQDAVAHVGDISYEARARRLTLGFNRFRWEAEAGKGGERVRSALQLNAVLSCQARNIRREPKDAVVSLLSIDFHPGDEAPGGVVSLTFAGGGELKCRVECVDALLADLTDPWPTKVRPTHELD